MPNLLYILGKQEFKGRSKKKTLSIRDKAQSKRSTGTTIKVKIAFYKITIPSSSIESIGLDTHPSVNSSLA